MAPAGGRGGPWAAAPAASPAARAAALAPPAARALAAALLALVGWWVHARLGGVAAGPGPDGSTSALFNWHPLLMTLAFPVLMSEALLAYRAPWRRDAPRWVGGARRRAGSGGCGSRVVAMEAVWG
jgi:hypothetical protein